MRRCPACNRTYTDEAMMFCADDGTQLVGEAAPAGPSGSPSSQPTIAASAPYTPPPPAPPASNYQPTPKRRKWLGLIALGFGLLAMPFLIYSLSQPLLREWAFRNANVSLLFPSLWGAITTFGFLLAFVSVIAALIALGVSFKNPARYGGRLLAVAGSVLSVFLMVLVIGAFAFRRMQGPMRFSYDANDNTSYNSNDNSSNDNSSNDNSSTSSNSIDNYNSNSSDSSDSSSESSTMSEQDKYRLFYAAAKSGDPDLQQRAARKIGIVDSSGMPTGDYQDFIKGMTNWAFTDSAWVRQMDTTAKARAYAEERL